MSSKHRSLRGLLPGLTFLAAVGSAGIARAEAPRRLLPRGVRQTVGGRYSAPMCEPKPGTPGQGLNCLGRWLLPETWRPGMPLPARPGLVPQAPGAAGMAPADILAAYKVPASTAAKGKIVAILDAPDNHALDDLNGYRNAYGIPPLPRCAGMPTGSGAPCFAQINGDNTPSTGTDPSPREGDGETDIDMDMVSAACPDCSILLVEISPYYCQSDMVRGVATASKLGAAAISVSLGMIEMNDPNAATIDAGPPSGTPPCPEDVALTSDRPGPYSTPGHVVFVASGDFGYLNENFGVTGTTSAASPSYPASTPDVIAVGGTTLYSQGGAYAEGVWNDGNFGIYDPNDPSKTGNKDITTSRCSTEFAMPPWQATALAGTGCKMRATADLSAAAMFVSGTTVTGISVYFNGQMVSGIYGTSAAAPLVAGLFTRLGLITATSKDLAWVYDHASVFNDVGSSGYPIPDGGANSDSHTNGCGKLCTAGPGWDGPTGVGSPNATAMVGAGPIGGSGSSSGGGSGGSSGGGSGGSSGGSSGGGSSGGSSGGGSGGSSGGSGSGGGGSGSGSGGGSGSGSGGGVGGGGVGVDGGIGGSGSGSGGDGATAGDGDSSGCNVGPDGGSAAGAGWLAAVLGMALLRGRRRRR